MMCGGVNWGFDVLEGSELCGLIDHVSMARLREGLAWVIARHMILKGRLELGC
jgi:hypothetical protein